MTEPNQLDLFIPKSGEFTHSYDMQDLMMFPWFSLDKRNRSNHLSFKNKKVSIDITAPEKIGLATIWDYDILLYAISKISDGRNRLQKVNSKLEIATYDLLTFTQRGTSGRSYQRLEQALKRLLQTSIVTNIRMEDQERIEINTRTSGFHWINSYDYVKNEKTGRIQALQIELSTWTYRGISSDNLLRSTTEYFSLTGGYERWLYRLIRKHGGKQPFGWQFPLNQLHERSGANNRFDKFILALEKIVEKQSIPQYKLTFTEQAGEPFLHFRCVDKALLES
jgi:plasmid replication initiation protein